MALQQELTAEVTQVGMAAPEAYLKISGLSVSDNFVSISVEGYGSATARQNNLHPIFYQQYHAELPAITGTGNLIEICYEYLKTLDSFSGATDV